MMSKPDPITIQETLNSIDAEFLQEKLNRFNRHFAPPDHHQALVLLARNKKGVIVGGLAGVTYWGWLHIDILWVKESLRHKGIGQRLLQAAEEEAVQRGCHYSHLETHTFQALGFYEKHDYQVYGGLPDFPDGYTKYFLNKNMWVNEGNRKEKGEGSQEEYGIE
jgi:GNAT superfamily N-acetyltransferase